MYQVSSCLTDLNGPAPIRCEESPFGYPSAGWSRGVELKGLELTQVVVELSMNVTLNVLVNIVPDIKHDLLGDLFHQNVASAALVVAIYLAVDFPGVNYSRDPTTRMLSDILHVAGFYEVYLSAPFHHGGASDWSYWRRPLFGPSDVWSSRDACNDFVAPRAGISLRRLAEVRFPFRM